MPKKQRRKRDNMFFCPPLKVFHFLWLPKERKSQKIGPREELNLKTGFLTT
jgi:hypothetical protein